MIINIEIFGVQSGSTKYNFTNVRTAHGLKLPSQSLNLDHQKQIYRYIEDVPSKYYTNALPQVLIGSDNDKLILNYETNL